MLALKKDCVREMDGVKQPYILYASGGPNVSREGAEASGSVS